MKTLIMDLYGTLVNIRTDESRPAFRRAVQRRFEKVAGTKEDFWAQYLALCRERTTEPYADTDVADVFRTIFARYGAPRDEGSILAFARYFRGKSRRFVYAYPHVRKRLVRLKKAGVKLYLLSNAQACFTMDELRMTRLLPLLDGIYLSSDRGYGKPSPLFFDETVSRLCPTKDALYIGNDVDCDIRPAVRCGIRCAYVRTAISPAADSVSQALALTPHAFGRQRDLWRFVWDWAHN